MKLLRNQSGQGMTEYIIIVALIAVAAIGAFSYFGKTVRNQTAAMSESLAGNKSEAQSDTQKAGESAKQAGASGDKTLNLKSYVDEQPDS